MAGAKRTLLSSGAGMKLGMIPCYAVTLVPPGAFLVAGGTLGGFASNLGTMALLTLCLGTHLAMHRTMGRSCHDSAMDPHQQNVEEDQGLVAAVIPINAAR